MRIVIDMQGLQTPPSKNRGVGRYTDQIVREFIGVATKKHDVYLVMNGAFLNESIALINEFSEILPRSHIKCWQQYLTPVSGISGNDLGRNISEIVREYFIESLNPDIVWSTNLQEGWHDDAVTSVKRIKSKAVYVTTLHDVIPLIYPETHLVSKIKNWYLEKVEYAKRSDIILTVSDFSKRKIVELLGVDAKKVHVACNAISNKCFYPNESGVRLSESSYILYVGGGDEHKNLDILISAYDALPIQLKNQYCLKFVGGGLNKIVSDRAFKLGVAVDNFVFLDYVDDENLLSIYQGASLFVYPSLSEGFGIPPLEAMACGIPVISSNAASLPEVIGFERALFDPRDKSELTNLIAEVLADENFRLNLIEHGLSQSRKFSWGDSASTVLSIFEGYSTAQNLVDPCREDLYSRLIDELAEIRNIEKTNLAAVAKAIRENGFLNNQSVKKNRLYLDLSCLVHYDHATGIQRVVRAITDEVRKTKSDFFELVTVFSYAGHGNFYHVELKDGKYLLPDENRLHESVVEFASDETLVFLDLHPGSAISKENTIDRLRSIGVNVFFVVYDLLPVEFPNYFVEELSVEFKRWLEVVSKSDGVLCISKDVRDKYKQWAVQSNIRLPGSFKLNYFHLGADILNSMPSIGKPEGSEVFLEAIKGKPVFLMVGTVEPRKGHGFVLQAFDALWNSGSESVLVVVGKPGWRNEKIINKLNSNCNNGLKLFWLTNASDEFLELIYKNSTCLIGASEGEGFGLPLIEAAQHKIPIIARDIPVFREVAGEHAFYFQADKPEQLAHAIQNWLLLYKEDAHPKSDTMPWLTWKQSAQQFLAALGLQQEGTHSSTTSTIELA